MSIYCKVGFPFFALLRNVDDMTQISLFAARRPDFYSDVEEVSDQIRFKDPQSFCRQ